MTLGDLSSRATSRAILSLLRFRYFPKMSIGELLLAAAGSRVLLLVPCGEPATGVKIARGISS